MNSDRPEVKLTHTQSDCLPRMPAIEDALYIIGGKWKLKIIVMLFGGGNVLTISKKASREFLQEYYHLK